jgi:hypothetical protein
VRRDTSVARSAPGTSSPEVCSVVDSVGAGRGGFLRVSTPIAIMRDQAVMETRRWNVQRKPREIPRVEAVMAAPGGVVGDGGEAG